ncbi:MAG TPA: sigma-54 dependent transcriptional regulator, partial [Chthoniobacterales bacterium]|nr:sigma-54 dependent transcriptional regulator [Chthoniobacterales bacterium]
IPDWLYASGLDKSMKPTDSRTPCILIADDQPDVLEALRFLIKGEGYQAEAVNSPAAAIDAAESRDFDAVLMDLNYTRDTTSGQEGLEAIPRIQALDENLPIVVMTAWATIDLAVEAMKLGARDFVPKPWDNDRLLAIVRTQIALGSALRKSRQAEAKNELLRGKMPNIISESPRMRPVIDLISRVAPSDANVLITGENGTGKGLVARAIHSLSPRASKIMITVNMGGLSEGVFESELFGHVKGAFTDAKTDRAGRFELADESTLFLDEIANLPLSQQAKLLRVIETGEFERVGSSKTLHANVRIISATNANLHEEVAAGRFRQDLLFRLNTIEVPLPPLRERREDIAPLAALFLAQHADRYRKKLTGFETAAHEALVRHEFPGNVRELDHVIERAVLMAQGAQIKPNDLGLTSAAEGSPRLEEMSLEEVEAFLIKKALARHDGNARKAAESLGLSRSAFYRRLQQYGL